MIARIPTADRDRFAALLQGRRDGEERDRAAEEFREIIFEGLDGMPAARDMPDVVVSAARDYLLCSEDDLRQRWTYSFALERDAAFGVKHGTSRGFTPASAYHGPFLPLSRYHPHRAIPFLIEVFNHCADWYAHPRVPSEHAPQVFEDELIFADGTTRTQWCSAELWSLYRGTGSGPAALQSLLMALERWLLELAETRPGELDGVLLYLLKGSTSVMITAVVASVATAFPRLSGEALLVLLGSPLCTFLDRDRLTNESHVPSRVSALLPQLNPGNRVYEEERKEADDLPHRRSDLETAIINLQLGPLAPRVHEILDRYRAEMPPSDCTFRDFLTIPMNDPLRV